MVRTREQTGAKVGCATQTGKGHFVADIRELVSVGALRTVAEGRFVAIQRKAVASARSVPSVAAAAV